MNYQIKTMDDLDQAVVHLKSLERMQSEALKMRLSDPEELFRMLTKFVSKFGTKDELLEKLFIHPLTTFLSRMGLPVLLNKTLLKNANIFVKGLVILVSQKASGLTEQLFNSVLDELIYLFQRISK
jgi:hypothetical protein